jgi:DNA-binding winged helix-turn-helix (wHTH) protein/Tol biopolymer transport system component
LGVSNGASRLQFGSMTLIAAERLLLRDGQPVTLPPKAFELLAYFAAHPGRLLSKDELMSAVWPDAVVEESNLAYHVFVLRKVLGDDAETERFIATVPKKGYRFVADVVSVDAPEAAPSGPARVTGGRPVWPLTAAAMALWALVATAGFVRSRTAPDEFGPVHFREPAWGRPADSGVLSVSPDGRHLALASEGDDGLMRLWVRSLDALAPRPLVGGEVTFPVAHPILWSPDSRFIAAADLGALKRISLSGGAPQPLCPSSTHVVGGSWNRNGVILLGNPTGGLLRCAASGGRAEAFLTADSSLQESHLFPAFLPDGRNFLYLRVFRGDPTRSGLYLQSLDAPTPDGGPRVITTGFSAEYVPGPDNRTGVIMYAQDQRLLAQRFDERQIALLGEPTELAPRVGTYLDYAHFAASSATLVYREPQPPSQLTWFGRAGEILGKVGAPEQVAGLALAPDGTRAIVARHAPQSIMDQDLWLVDLAHGEGVRRFTSAPAIEMWPVWIDDGRVLFGSGGGGSGVYEQALDGGPRLLFQSLLEFPTSVSADGSVVLFTTFRDPARRTDIWAWTRRGPANGTPLLERPFDQTQAQTSPDARWMAFVSNETGRNEVFVAELRIDPSTGVLSVGAVARVSKAGGYAPRWRRDGRELLFLTVEGDVMSVAFHAALPLRLDEPRRLFTVPAVHVDWGVTADGARFLFAVHTAPPPPLHVIRGWQDRLPRSTR